MVKFIFGKADSKPVWQAWKQSYSTHSLFCSLYYRGGLTSNHCFNSIYWNTMASFIFLCYSTPFWLLFAYYVYPNPIRIYDALFPHGYPCFCSNELLQAFSTLKIILLTKKYMLIFLLLFCSLGNSPICFAFIATKPFDSMALLRRLSLTETKSH